MKRSPADAELYAPADRRLALLAHRPLSMALDAQSEIEALRFADGEQVIVSYTPWPHPCCGDR
jgi:hypothetical protein